MSRFASLIERGIEQFDEMQAQAAEQAERQKRKAPQEKAIVFTRLHGPYGKSDKVQIVTLPDRYPFDWLVNWLARWSLHPLRSLARMKQRGGPFRHVGRAWAFIKAHSGGQVVKGVFDERQVICNTCPKLDIVIGKSGGEHRYCRQCGCGHHRFARLTHKNRLVKWYCPLRKHPGPYPDDAARLYLTEAGYATQEELDGKAGGNRKSGGCGNCGGSDSAGNGKAGHEMAASTAGQEG